MEKKKRLTKEEKKAKSRRSKIVAVIGIPFGLYIVYGLVSSHFNTVDELSSCNTLLKSCVNNATQFCGENGLGSNTKSQIIKDVYGVVSEFMDSLFQSPYSFGMKFLIFLGIVYLFQITFSLGMDLLEIVMVLFVALKHLYNWIRSKFKSKKKEGDI